MTPDLFTTANEQWLNLARREAVRICQEEGSVSSDDVNKIVPFTGVSRNIIGAIFKGGQFRTIGTKKSTKPSRKGGVIYTWALK
jgi:hypothetical protein